MARAAVPILAAAVVLPVATWLDANVVRRLQQEAGASFDPNRLTLALSLGYLVVAGAVVVLALVVWRSRSAFAGLLYALVGGFLAFLPVITFRFAVTLNGAPPILPQPIADAVGNFYLWTLGLLNSVETIGAGMFLAGLAVILANSFRRSPAPVVERPIVDQPIVDQPASEPPPSGEPISDQPASEAQAGD